MAASAAPEYSAIPDRAVLQGFIPSDELIDRRTE
jgi:hypothetical protein